MGMPPTIILGLPRSRTTWLARFLSYGDWHCGHDELRHCRQIEDVKSWLSQPNTLTVETAAAPFWRLARHLSPTVRFVTIRRDPAEAAHSAVRAGLGDDFPSMAASFQRLDHKLEQVERHTGCRSFRYHDLIREEVCADLFEHCLPYHHGSARWASLDREHIQTDAAALCRYVQAHAAQLERLSAIARQKSLSLLKGRRAPEVTGLTLGFEPLQVALRDAEPLQREHCAEVGEHPDTFANKNTALLQANEDAGGLLVTVARCNGRMFGYLVTLIGESMEIPGRLWACHTAFYGSPAIPGLGLKLQRKAAEGLRARGVYEVVMRAGVRGSGDRVSTIYRRMGAEPFGEYFRLQLEEAA